VIDFDWMKERDGILGRTDGEIERLRSTVTELVAALEPFAKFLDHLPETDDLFLSQDDLEDREEIETFVIIGDIRRARAAIQKAHK
jgi:hypothetical protein